MAKLTPDLFEEMEKSIMDLFTYEQHFFFINGPRTTGKTYTLQKIMLKKCMKRDEEIGFITRTKDEYLTGAAWQSFQKVFTQEFPNVIFEEIKNDIYYRLNEKDKPKRIIVGLPLSQALKWKNRANFPKIAYILFDEYMIEVKDGILQGNYVQGWNEPELFLNFYNTIDRLEGRVKVFFAGNNTQFYNPYHTFHKFKNLFRKIPEKGQIVKGPDEVFWRVKPSDKLVAFMKNDPFLKSMEGTRYYTYAVEGNYQDDVANIEKLPQGAKTIFALKYEQTIVYVHRGYKDNEEKLWLSYRGDPNTTAYAVRGNDVSANVTLFTGTFWHEIFRKYHSSGNIYFSDSKSKTMCQDFLYLVLTSYRKV